MIIAMTHVGGAGDASVSTPRRGVRLGLYSTGEPAPTQLTNSADDALFERILHNPNHVFHCYLISTQQVIA